MGLARLAEGFNPARGNGEVIYPSKWVIGGDWVSDDWVSGDS
jgi:hypothetical protein